MSGSYTLKGLVSRRIRLSLLLLSCCFYAGCGFVGFPGVYRIDIEQGNLVDQEMIEQLELGMSRRQVRFIMGSPLVEDTFNPDRWDYPYVIRNGTDIIREAQVSIYFDEDVLERIEGDYLPEWARGDEPASDGSDNDATEGEGEDDANTSSESGVEESAEESGSDESGDADSEA